jgi:single-strand DNA-binding protein
MPFPNTMTLTDTTDITDIIARASQHLFVGRLGSDPDLKSFQSGRCVASARFAVNHPDARREDRDATDWFTVEVWNQDAERFVDQAHKGDMVRIWGRVKVDSYQGRDGERTNLVIKPTSWEVLPTPARQQEQAPAPARAAAPTRATTTRRAPAAPPTWHSSSQADEDEEPF